MFDAVGTHGLADEVAQTTAARRRFTTLGSRVVSAASSKPGVRQDFHQVVIQCNSPVRCRRWRSARPSHPDGPRGRSGVRIRRTRGHRRVGSRRHGWSPSRGWLRRSGDAPRSWSSGAASGARSATVGLVGRRGHRRGQPPRDQVPCLASQTPLRLIGSSRRQGRRSHRCSRRRYPRSCHAFDGREAVVEGGW